MKVILMCLLLTGCASSPALPNCLSLIKIKVEVCPTD